MRIAGWHGRSMLIALAVFCPCMVAAGALTLRADEPDAIKVALVRYQAMDEEDADCFSHRFLTHVARTTDLPVQDALAHVVLSDDALFDYPFVVLTGQGELALSEQERANLEAYLGQGGFVLASARCADEQWGQSFAALIAEIAQEIAETDEPLQPLDAEHALLQTLYDIERVSVRDPSLWHERGEALLQSWEHAGRIRVLFSPAGLNASEQRGPDCRCCEGVEIQNATLIKANALTYALTR